MGWWIVNNRRSVTVQLCWCLRCQLCHIQTFPEGPLHLRTRVVPVKWSPVWFDQGTAAFNSWKKNHSHRTEASWKSHSTEHSVFPSDYILIHSLWLKSLFGTDEYIFVIWTVKNVWLNSSDLQCILVILLWVCIPWKNRFNVQVCISKQFLKSDFAHFTCHAAT